MGLYYLLTNLFVTTLAEGYGPMTTSSKGTQWKVVFLPIEVEVLNCLLGSFICETTAHFITFISIYI